MSVAQSDLQCPSCAGQCAFDPMIQGLTCTSCGESRSLSSPWDGKAASETRYVPGREDTKAPALPESTHYQCETCGGEVTFTGPALSTHCPYCDGPVVMTSAAEGFRAMALIPFQMPAGEAPDHIARWIKGRLCAPNDLGTTSAEGRMAGLYAPFWTFDSTEFVRYTATYRRGSGDRARRVSVRDSLQVHFDDMLAPASDHVTPLIRDGILHDFDPQMLKPYRAGYLAGFAAERHRQSVAEGLASNEADKRLLLRNRVKDHVNEPATQVSHMDIDTSGIHYRRILLPVWILHYSYGGKPMKVVVSGIDGRTYGERPFSRMKLLLASAMFAAAAVAFGFFWGYAAAP